MKLSKITLVTVIVMIVVGYVVFRSVHTSTNAVRIGVISPLSGLVENGDNLGQSFANGFTLAQEEYEKNNGLRIEAVIEDDGYDSKKGLSAYHKLVSIDHVDGLVNLSSPTIDVITPEVHAAGLPVLQLGAESEISEDTIFQIYPDQTSVKMIADVANQDGVKDVTVVMEQIKAYEKFLSDFQDNFHGTTHLIRIPTTQKDYNPVALKVKENNSGAVLMFASSVVGGKIFARMSTIGYKPPRIYFDLGLQLGINDYKTALGTDIGFLDGAKALYSVAKTDKDFSARYRARFGSQPGFLSGYGYDAFTIMAATYSPDRKTWLHNIQSYKAEGVTGSISFGDTGLRPPEFVVAGFQHGEFVVPQ